MTVNITTVDRLYGVNEGIAAKAPCRAASTGAALALAGLNVVDGLLLNTGDRVLVKDQGDATQNGIYSAQVGPWLRTSDADGNRDFVRGTRVAVTDGQINASTIWMLLADNPVTVGTSVQNWVINNFPDAPADDNVYGRRDNQWAQALPIIGGTMAGELKLAGPPVQPMDAAPKSYVDGLTLGGVGDAPADGTMYGRQSNAWTRALAIAGDTMTGPLTLAADPAAALQCATKQYVDTRVAVAAIQGAFKNLFCTGQSLNNHTVFLSADSVVLFDGTSYFAPANISVTCDLNTSGPNGLDQGVIATNTWYALYIIQNATTLQIAALASLNFSRPNTMPSGFARFARVSACRTTSGGAGAIWAFSQRGRKSQYVPFSGSPVYNNSLPILLSGAAGSISASAFAPIAVAWAQVAPPTAANLRLTGTAVAGVTAGVAPNPTYGGVAQATQSPPPIAFNNGAVVSSGSGEILLETSNIYYASTGATLFFCLGYEDNL